MKKVVFVLVSLLFCTQMFADVRTADVAAQIAAGFLNGQQSVNQHRAPAAQDMQLVMTAQDDNQQPALYLFNSPQGGFAVVSANDATEAVLCYSMEGQIAEADMPAAMRWWLKRLAKEVGLVGNADFAGTSRRAPRTTTVTPVKPLLGNIAWGQTKPFNDLCPVDDNDGTLSLTGCVATGAAQIMRYWKYPQRGTGKITYTWYNYDRTSALLDDVNEIYERCFKTEDLVADFGNTIYDWDNMLEVYGKTYTTAQAEAVSTLLYHCGIACGMKYAAASVGGSGAYVEDMGKSMRDYFGYKYSAILSTYYDPSLEASDFYNAFNADLEAGRPILLAGVDPVLNEGHAFVCDGRDEHNDFHFNWGWEGYGDCYTSLTVMHPEIDEKDYHFTDGFEACVGLEPMCKDIYTTAEMTICDSELPYKWEGVTFDAAGTKKAILKSKVTGCDSVVTFTLKVNPTFNTTDGATVCQSELPYTWEGETFNAAGSKVKTLSSKVTGCDSVVTFTLKVNPTFNITDGATVCQSELPYTWEGETFDAAGSKVKTLSSKVTGCDSVVTFTLTVNPTYSGIQDGATVCQSELPYTWEGETFNAAGSKVKTLSSNVTGCDSVVTFTLTVHPTFVFTDGASICSEIELPYHWQGIDANGPFDFVFTEQGSRTETLTSIYGCDSVVTFTLTVLPTYNMEPVHECTPTLPYEWRDGNGNLIETLTSYGKKSHTLKTVDGCDSIVTIILSRSYTDISDSHTICDSELPFSWEGETFTAAGSKTKTLASKVSGCDSVVTFTLNVNPTYRTTDGAVVCESSLPYQWRNKHTGELIESLSYAGTRTHTLQSVTGCDSIVTFTLTVNPTINTTDGATICESELPYTWEDETFDAVGSKVKTLSSKVTGCDSIVTFTLKVNLPTSKTIEHTLEVGTTWKDRVFNEVGDVKWEEHLVNAANCDSTVYYIVHVEPVKFLWNYESNDEDMGNVLSDFNDARYVEGTVITAKAVPEEGYKFVRWNNGSKMNPYTFTILSDTYLRAIFAEENSPETNMTAQVENNKVIFTWTIILGAEKYTLTIYGDAGNTQVLFTLVFDSTGHLLSMDDAAKSSDAPARARAMGDDIFEYVADFLQPSKTYYFSVITTDNSEQVLDTETGMFTTNAIVTSVSDSENTVVTTSFIKDGHLYILRNGVLYNATGTRIK